MILEEQAKVVRMIFDWYINGKNVIGIVKELEKLNIKSPTDKDTWLKRTIDTMLSNDKYAGNVILFKKGLHSECCLSMKNHPAIISDETLKASQIEKVGEVMLK